MCTDSENIHVWNDNVAGDELLYSGNFRGRKLSWILWFCGYLWKFSLWNIGAWCPLVRQKRTIHESFLCENPKIIISPIHKRFFFRKFSAIRYTDLWNRQIQYTNKMCNATRLDVEQYMMHPVDKAGDSSMVYGTLWSNLEQVDVKMSWIWYNDEQTSQRYTTLRFRLQRFDTCVRDIINTWSTVH